MRSAPDRLRTSTGIEGSLLVGMLMGLVTGAVAIGTAHGAHHSGWPTSPNSPSPSRAAGTSPSTPNTGLVAIHRWSRQVAGSVNHHPYPWARTAAQSTAM